MVHSFRFSNGYSGGFALAAMTLTLVAANFEAQEQALVAPRRTSLPEAAQDAVGSLTSSIESSHTLAVSLTGRFAVIGEELPERKHGAFTVAVCEALTGKADHDDDGRLTILEYYEYVYRRVAELTNDRQRPVRPIPNAPEHA